ncbi:DEAD/DEAH box helicase [Shouchella shacheensis]|uniref:DEAD/DEAH box helicase n=1 Tax=Shouchella shacheensis TaxID=1649580 RepID=UPI00073FFB3D|nr:DEAD/DEAH box helicase [Shouchella shacheensis]
MNGNIIVHAGWLNDDLFLWGEKPVKNGETQNGFMYPFLFSPFELKLSLYRHHTASFYGTFIDTTRALLRAPLHKRVFQSPAGETIIYQADESWQHYTFPIEGIRLELDDFVSQYTLMKAWEHDEQLVLAEDLQAWLTFCDAILAMIEAGKVEPASSGTWQLTVPPSWYKERCESFPYSSLALKESQSLQKEVDSPEGSERLERQMALLVDAFVRYMLRTPTISEAFAQWQKVVAEPWQPFVKNLQQKQTSPAQTSGRRFSEELGIHSPDPFQSALVLKEPEQAEGSWSLSASVIDRKQRDTLIAMGDLLLGEHPWRSNPIPRLKADLLAARERVSILESLTLASPEVKLSANDAYDLFTKDEETLKDIGFQLIVPKWLNQKRKMTVQLQTTSGQQGSGADPLLNWQEVASFTYEVAIGDVSLSEKDFEAYVESNRPFIYAGGQWIAWDPALADKLKSYLDSINTNYTYLDAWKLARTEESMDELEEIDWAISWSEELENRLTALYRKQPESIAVPPEFKGELRGYQQEGASWLSQLRQIGFGGCLADDMGLGKSIQTIVYVLHVLQKQREEGVRHSPFLLICPTSLLYNWAAECRHFAPSLALFIHHGQERLSVDDERLDGVDLVLTSYALALRDQSFFGAAHWNGLILDEAQHIKNKDTKQRKAIRQLYARHRLALTGTPIENRLQELWSLMDLLNPSLLGRFSSFQRAYIRPIERDHDEETQKQLQRLIRPFLLRRTKTDPKTDLGLPAKHEETRLVSLSLEQAALYQAVVDEVSSKLNAVSPFERRALILRAITKLKQICNHPAQFLKSGLVSEHESGKWEAFLELATAIRTRGEKMLVFTQYKEMGKLISAHLAEEWKSEVPFLHGGLSRTQRQHAIETFQNDPDTYAFVLSLKAGGVGLNLTKATHVIHYDRWWNPAVENQATDRAYRIGQTEQVRVYKFMTQGTVEERIDRMIETKQALAEGVLSQSQAPQVTELEDEELLALIRLTHD